MPDRPAYQSPDFLEVMLEAGARLRETADVLQRSSDELTHVQCLDDILGIKDRPKS